MISGKQVKIRGIKKEDASLIYEWVNREDLRNLTGTLYPVSEYEHEKWLESVLLSGDKKLFAIEEDGCCIGTIGLKNFDETSRNAELFISIGAASRKRGGGGRVCQLVDRFLLCSS